jgi:hypothetical protein
MRIFQIARNLPQGLRAALAVLLLIFAVNSVADAGHHHERGAATVHAGVCGYCATFGTIADGMVHATSITASPAVSMVVAERDVGFVSPRPFTTAQPRAPPFH